MAQKPMYPVAANSPQTELANAITATDTEIELLNGAVLLAGPNLATIGTDDSAETILYETKTGNVLSGVTRGFDGTAAKGWPTSTKAARYLTAYDIEALQTNVVNAQERADAAFQQASDGKTAVAAAITGMGQTATAGDTFTQLASKVKDISKDANAGVGEVLSGKTFYQGGAKRTGTMPNRGSGSSIGSGDGSDADSLFYGSAANSQVGRLDFIMPATQSGYYPAGSPINLHIKNLLPEYIRGDVRVGGTHGIQGTMPVRGTHTGPVSVYYEPTAGSRGLYVRIPRGAYVTDGPAGYPEITVLDEDFIAANIRSDKNIFGLQGGIPVNNASQLDAYSYRKSSSPGKFYVMPVYGIYENGAEVAYTDPNFLPENIRSGISMLGVTGTLTPGVRTAKGTNALAADGIFNITGLAFTPRLVIVNFNYTYVCVYCHQDYDAGIGAVNTPATAAAISGNAGYNTSLNMTTPLTVSGPSFSGRFPTGGLARSIFWLAVE